MKKSFYLLTLVLLIAIFGGGSKFIPRAEAEGQCFIRFNIFDSKIYDPSMAENILLAKQLITKGALIDAIKNRKLPFDSSPKDSGTIGLVFDKITAEICKGTCDPKILDMQIICEPTVPTGSTIDEAQLAYNQRIAKMNPCQKDAFMAIQTKNSRYLQAAKAVNNRYYQELAPLTVNLLKLHRYTKDDQAREQLLSNYVLANKELRRTLYKSQTTLFTQFIKDRTTLQEAFNACK